MKVVILLLIALLSGCASQAIEPSYYLLRSNQDLPSSKLSPSVEFALGTIEIAPYLNQLGLMIDIADNQVRPAVNHLWAEPIYDGIRTLLTTDIAAANGEQLMPARLSTDATVVNIRIDKLDGTLDGTAQILAYWWLVRGGEIVNLNRFSTSRALTASGYSALVEAERGLLEELARKIAASLIPAPS
ncbi:MAG: ABC-type transport auxiliary lipoprotein family protein [Halioglobus sp.]|nr:ABC-type transport auxiliary lipoprotein family protein [Halioglobus sp.]